MDGETSPEDQIPAVFNLLNRIVAFQVDHLSIGFGKLRPHDPGPVIQTLADEIGAQSVSRGLQGGRVGNRQESVIVLAEINSWRSSSRSM